MFKNFKLVNYLTILVFGVIFLCLGILFYWSFQSTDVLQVNNAPFPARIISSNSDKLVIMSVDFCKNTNAKGKVRVSYVSPSREVFLPIGDEQAPEGCVKTDYPIIIPKDLEPDTYKLHFRVAYDINPLKQNIVNEFDSQTFSLKANDVR